MGYLENDPSGLPSTWTTNADHTVNVSTFTYSLTGPSADVNFDLAANLLCDRGFTCDFGHTAKFTLDLPPGTTFTSDSGVFLTASGAVPEPAAWSMMIVGFALVGGAMRGRKVRRRPLRDIVERFRADLKLKPDWSLWTGDGWASHPPLDNPRPSLFPGPNRRQMLKPERRK